MNTGLVAKNTPNKIVHYSPIYCVNFSRNWFQTFWVIHDQKCKKKINT